MYAPRSVARSRRKTHVQHTRRVTPLNVDSYSTSLIEAHLESLEATLGSSRAAIPYAPVDPAHTEHLFASSPVDTQWAAKLAHILELHEQLEEHQRIRGGVVERARGALDIYRKKKSLHDTRQQDLLSLRNVLEPGADSIAGILAKVTNAERQLGEINRQMDSGEAARRKVAAEGSALKKAADDASQALGQKEEEFQMQSQIVSDAQEQLNRSRQELEHHKEKTTAGHGRATMASTR